MGFSFFKKPQETMIAKPAVAPRGKEPREPAPADKPAGATPSVSPAEHSAPSTSGFSNFEFSEASADFHVEMDIDPVDSEAEEAAVLYANGQDEAVRSVLEGAIALHRSGPAERLWLLLFDFYRLGGHKAEFEALEIEYAKAFEKSPPTWRDQSSAKPKAKEASAGSVFFRGDLLAENNAGFEALRQALEKSTKSKIDFSKVAQLDSDGCQRLLDELQRARKAKREFELLGRDILGELVQSRVDPEQVKDQGCWLLLLELCQLQGQQEAFEEVAINYAISFEVSPPSWESKRVAAPEPEATAAAEHAENESGDEAYMLRGQVKASRFGDLLAHAETKDPVVLDCSELARMDFISAGALLNVLTTVRRTGKQVVFRHPNHLVAELFGVVGLKTVANIVFAKH